MHYYNVYVYFFLDKISDCYTVVACNPYEAQKTALARIFVETDYYFDEVEVTKVLMVTD